MARLTSGEVGQLLREAYTTAAEMDRIITTLTYGEVPADFWEFHYKQALNILSLPSTSWIKLATLNREVRKAMEISEHGRAFSKAIGKAMKTPTDTTL